MAKIGTISIEINGEKKEYNINVGKEGLFRVHIDYKIAETIGLPTGKIEFGTLDGLKSFVYEKYNSYLDARLEYSVWIGIEYKASGYFTENKKGHVLFGRHNSEKPFYDDATRFGIGSSLVFGYKFYIRENHSTGRTLWYECKKLKKDYSVHQYEKVHEGFVFGLSPTRTDGKLVPYSEKAENTLFKAKEGLRSISEILFEFMNQDEQSIEASLIKGNLLK